ncbi:MAG: ATP-binding protein [Candidatus Competibacteraceae bacterium]|jgi:predicted AAA+ superfamily ATPase|nr:ATP-binding protein [Candidatus Competibacteraceae bacterium]
MSKEPEFIERGLRHAISIALTDTPVVCILGPRQSGKSTLVQQLRPDRAYFDLDDLDLAATASADPSGFVKALPVRVTLDEIQRVPELLGSIKISVDRQREPGRFILTGSANLLLLPRTSESLAGRMEVLRLYPLTESEKERAPGVFLKTLLEGNFKPEIRPTEDSKPLSLAQRLVMGGYPEVIQRSHTRIRDWHKNYLLTIMERDIRDVARILDSTQLERLLIAVAHQSAGLLNRSALSRDLSLDRDTINHYLDILEKLFLIRLLPAWHRNRGKRLVKSPKTHLLDCGLAATLIELQPEEWNTRRTDFGKVLESFVVRQLVAQGAWTDSGLRFWHYRDRDQVEVDCVITRGAAIWGVEVKASRSVSRSDTKGLQRLAEQTGKDFRSGIVLHTGESTFRLGDDRFLAVPISKLWEL